MSHMCNFRSFVATLKKQKLTGQMNLNHVFYLTQYTPNIGCAHGYCGRQSRPSGVLRAPGRMGGQQWCRPSHTEKSAVLACQHLHSASFSLYESLTSASEFSLACGPRGFYFQCLPLVSPARFWAVPLMAIPLSPSDIYSQRGWLWVVSSLHNEQPFSHSGPLPGLWLTSV